MGRFTEKQMQRARDGTLAPRPRVERVSPIKTLNSRPRMSGSMIFCAYGEAFNVPPSRSPRKKRPAFAVDTTQAGDAHDLHPPVFDTPGAGARRRAAQFDNWQKILPSLVEPLLQLQYDTQFFRNMSDVHLGEDLPCSCTMKRALTIAVIRMNGTISPTYGRCRTNKSNSHRGNHYSCLPLPSIHRARDPSARWTVPLQPVPPHARR